MSDYKLLQSRFGLGYLVHPSAPVTGVAVGFDARRRPASGPAAWRPGL